ncbi:MAG: type IV secretion system protein [Acidobacteriota bacterium]
MGARSPEGLTPEVLAQIEAETLFGIARREKRAWQWLCFALAAMLVCFAVGLVRLSLAKHYTLWAVEVSPLGEVLSVGPVPEWEGDEIHEAAFLRTWIHNARVVVGDLEMQRRFWRAAFAAVLGDAKDSLRAYYGAEDWTTLGRRQSRMVYVEAPVVLERTPALEGGTTLWQVSWAEVVIDRTRGTERWHRYEGFLRTTRIAPKDTESLGRNPLGLYIEQLRWRQVGAEDQGVSR